MAYFICKLSILIMINVACYIVTVVLLFKDYYTIGEIIAIFSSLTSIILAMYTLYYYCHKEYPGEAGLVRHA